MEPVVFRITADHCVVYKLNNPDVKGCYVREGKGITYVFKGAVNLFEDVGYFLDGDDMDFIEGKPQGLPKKISLEMEF